MNALLSGRKLLLLLLAVTVSGAVASAGEKNAGAASPALKVHPKVFSMVQGWLSDGESPIVTEINLDAVAASRNQFDHDGLKQEEGWTRCAGPDGDGFLRYRVLEAKGARYKVEFQENGGGSLTTAALIEFAIEKREVRVNDKPATIRVLRVLSYRAK
jgi:hypothetical protein